MNAAALSQTHDQQVSQGDTAKPVRAFFPPHRKALIRCLSHFLAHAEI